MIEKIIKSIILALVLALVYWCATLVIGVIHAPPVLATIVLVLLVLCFAAWLLRSFNIVACLVLSFLFLTSCAHESASLASRLRPARVMTQCNGTNVTIRLTPNSYYFHADTLDNSTPTTAGAEGFRKGAVAIGQGISVGAIGVGSSGILHTIFGR